MHVSKSDITAVCGKLSFIYHLLLTVQSYENKSSPVHPHKNTYPELCHEMCQAADFKFGQFT